MFNVGFPETVIIGNASAAGKPQSAFATRNRFVVSYRSG